MKHHSATISGHKHIIGFLLLFFMVSGFARPAHAVTYYYQSAPFDIGECEYVFGGSAPCSGGSFTATVTVSDAAPGPVIDDKDIISWSVSAPQIGTISGSRVTPGDRSFLLTFGGGRPVAWDVIINGDTSGGAHYDIEFNHGDGIEGALAFINQSSGQFLGYTTEPGGWTGGGGGGISRVIGNPADSPGGCSTGNPCSVGTGNKFQEVTDYSTSGQHALGFTRYYNSLADNTSFAKELGPNWRGNFDRYLHITSGSAITVERGDGQGLNFTLNGSTWTGDSDVDIKISGGAPVWTLTDHNDTIETYRAASPTEAVLDSIVYRDGYKQQMTYNAQNQLTKVTDSYGHSLSFTYDTNGLLTQVATPDALVLSYGYDANNMLTSVSYNTNPATSQHYSYVNTSDLASITDENGNVFASWTYDSQHRAASSQHGTGAERVDITYFDDGSRAVTNALGQQTAYTFTTLQGVPKITKITRAASPTVPAATETFTYDSNGYTASQTDWNGNTTTYVNDAHGEPTSITEASGTAQARTTTITYDTTYQHLPHQIVAPGKTTTFTYDSLGNVLTRAETDTSVANGPTRTWTYTYDASGHMLTATNPLGAVTTNTYNGDNIATVTDALGHISKITAYTAGGQPLTMIDPNGVATTFTYDTRNRLSSRTIDGATTSFAYDAAGNLSALTLPDGSQIFYTYDTAHRVTQVKNNLGETITYTLDANDDITRQQIAGTSITKTQSAAFDSLGRMLQQIGAYNETTGFAYDANGNRTGTRDALNNLSTQGFDALNRLIKSVDPLNNTTSYTLDAQDNTVAVTDPRNLTTSYTHNGFGEVTSQTSPDTGTTTYTLDAAGNRIKEVDARGITTVRTFDKLNRILTEQYPSANENVAYTYDQGQFGIGRLSSFKDESGSTAFTYNARGDILTDTRNIGKKTYVTAYTYDLADHVASITYPSGDTVTYSRDKFGRINAVAMQKRDRDRDDNGRAIASNVTYEPFGPISGFTFGNGVAETFTYDQDYRLTNILAKGKTTIQNLTMVYDGVNNITSITDGVVSGDHDNGREGDKSHGDEKGRDSTSTLLNQTFTYDADYRLLTANGPYGAEAFAYDADGNRISATEKGLTSTYAYPSTSNQLSLITGGNEAKSFTYDAAGNTTEDSNTKFAYNSRNRNSGLETHDHDGFGSAKYLYNALGERVRKEANGNNHHDGEGEDHDDHGGRKDFIYDQQSHIIAETHSEDDGHAGKEYVYLNDLPIAEIDGGQTLYIHADHLGTPQKMTDREQKIVWSRVSDPFGKIVSITGDKTLNLRFPGQYHDAESGLAYNFFRSYNPESGRYTQSDPIGLSGGINTYGYAGQNPINRIDPKGLQFYDPALSNEVACVLAGYPPEQCAPPPRFLTPFEPTYRNVCEVGISLPCKFLVEDPPAFWTCEIGTTAACKLIPEQPIIKTQPNPPQSCPGNSSKPQSSPILQNPFSPQSSLPLQSSPSFQSSPLL